MKKRNFDITIWRKRWFRLLPPKIKCFWYFILSECDDAGVWSVDMEAAEYHIGEKADANDILASLVDNLGREQITILSDVKWQITDFIKFHYPDGLTESNHFHRGVIRLLKKHDLKDVGPILTQGRASVGINKTNTKTNTKKKQPEDTPEAIALRDLWNNYRQEQYGLGIDDSKGTTLKWIDRRIVEHSAEILKRCIDRRFKQLAIEGTEGRYIGKVTNFFGEQALYENYLADNWRAPKPKQCKQQERPVRKEFPKAKTEEERLAELKGK